MSNNTPAIQPRREKATLPDGYVPADMETRLLPWQFVDERMAQALVYWIATVRPDSRPHVTPLWGVWIDNTLYFDGSPESRRGRNLAQNPEIAAHVESGGAGKEVVIVEGRAREIKKPDLALREALAAAYSAKYKADGYAPTPDTWEDGGLFILRPRVVLAWTDMPHATRWRFDQS